MVSSRSAATVGDIVRYNDAALQTRWRPAVALALAFWVAVIGVEWTLPSAQEPPHGPHALVAGPHGEFAVPTDHPHLTNESTPVAPDTFAEAVLPRATITLVALALMAALATIAVFWRQASLPAIRGPPRRLAVPQSGRVILTRLCIARR